jgi:hypothetical protein
VDNPLRFSSLKDCYYDHIPCPACKPLGSRNLLHRTLAAPSNPL